MATTIPQRELRNRNAAIIDAVVAGESFIVTRNGTPVAELRPISTRPRRTFVPREELIAMAAASEPIDFAQFRADIDEGIDPYFDPDRWW